MNKPTGWTNRRRWFAPVALGTLVAAAVTALAMVGTASAATTATTWSPLTDFGSMYNVSSAIGARQFWAKGYMGAGIDIAVIDTGIVPVQGLQATVHGPDLSFESANPKFRDLDTYSHGTHLAGIVAGRDPASSTSGSVLAKDQTNFLGIAPFARVVSIKVGCAQGEVDVSQVIAAIDWVVANRSTGGLNIRVLCLAFGTDGTQAASTDPLAFAVEQAWLKGIVVVVAAGNDGTTRSALNDPAMDPYVIAVGASSLNGTLVQTDDTVPTWSGKCSTRTPNLVAPGDSIVSLRDPGSYADAAHPELQVATRFFKGSGTSQSAAVVAGAAALILSKWSTLTPDRVKRLLTTTTQSLKNTTTSQAGAGELNLTKALNTTPPSYTQTATKANGTGTLEAARGTNHVADNGVTLSGEKDIFANTWSPSQWTALCAKQTSWAFGVSPMTWVTHPWLVVDSASVNPFPVAPGPSNTILWDGGNWAGRSWSATGWPSNMWTNGAWVGTSWNSQTWSFDSRRRWSTRW